MTRTIRQYLWLYAFLLVIIVTASYVIYFLNVMKNNYGNNLISHKHCLSELDSLKYQLHGKLSAIIYNFNFIIHSVITSKTNITLYLFSCDRI